MDGYNEDEHMCVTYFCLVGYYCSTDDEKFDVSIIGNVKQ